MATSLTPTNTSTDTMPKTLSSAPAYDTGAVNSSIESGIAPIQQSIMQKYASARQTLAGQGSQTTKALYDTGQMDKAFLNEQIGNSLTSAQESQRGFAANPGALNYLQDSSTKRIRDLNTQIQDALANNQTSVANQLSNLQVQENTALTNARTAFLNQYFGAQQEARAQSSYQTPAQSAVMTLATQHPDAGISQTDDLATATAKVQKSKSFITNVAQGQANINQANASAGLAGAQSQYQRTLTGFMSGDVDPTDVQALIKNQQDPSTGASIADLQNKYASYPPGYVAKIISAAQQQGYQPATASLGNLSQETTTRNLAGGNLQALGAGVIGTTANKFLGNSGAGTGNSVIMYGPDGKKYNVPMGQAGAFIAKGGHY